MSRLPRPAAGLFAAVVLTAGCMVPVVAPAEEPDGGAARTAAPAPTSSAGGSAQWRPCPEVARELLPQVPQATRGKRFDCATVAVPRDWSDRSGLTYNLALIRIRAADQRDRIGSLVLNPGGPGASGIDTAVYLSLGPALRGLPAEITQRFDIVGFDPRGVQRSSPVDCVTDADQDATFAAEPDPDTQAEFDAVVALNKRVAQGCGAKYGAQLPLFSTEQAARDMDAVRAAVGDDKLTYLGYSYGTLLGATYAQLFPKRVRALVLDGAVDPQRGLVAGSEAQAKGFERAFDNFAAWCRSEPAACPIGPDARKAVTDAIAAAERSPVRGKDGRDATAGWVFLAVVASLYDRSGWRRLATAVADLSRGDATGVFDLADGYADRDDRGRYTNMFDANVVVNCADTDAKVTAAQVRTLQGQWRAKYPLFGAPLAVGMLPCVFWPPDRDPYPTGEAVGAPAIVVVGTTGDPATPYENTAKLAAMLGVGRVLTWEGEGHTAYPNTRCITDAVDRYLIDLTVPAEGLRCPAR